MQAFSLWLLRLVTGVAVVVYVVLRYLVLGQKLLHAEVGQLRMLPWLPRCEPEGSGCWNDLCCWMWIRVERRLAETHSGCFSVKYWNLLITSCLCWTRSRCDSGPGSGPADSLLVGNICTAAVKGLRLPVSSFTIFWRWRLSADEEFTTTEETPQHSCHRSSVLRTSCLSWWSFKHKILNTQFLWL